MQNRERLPCGKYIKSDVTRERDLGQVNFIDKGFESTTDLHVKKQLQEIPHNVFETFIELEVVDTHEAGLSMAHRRYNKDCKRLRQEMGLRGKPHAMQCVRGNHSGPMKNTALTLRRKVTTQFQF